jgi:DNA-binding transcriptional regulator YhcF (GntR family)
MEFQESQPIYLQIADMLCENVLNGSWRPGDRVPSIRELAESIAVNPNTVVRAYSYLQDHTIIHNQRGIGYFVAENAREITRDLERKRFLGRELPRVFRTMKLLEIGFDELRKLYTEAK